MTLAEIGNVAGRHPSTVSYHLKKNDLSAVNAARFSRKGSLPREDLEHLALEGASLKEMAERFDRSISTVRYWLSRYGLSAAKGGARRVIALEALSNGTQTVELKCRHHGLTAHAVGANGYYRCKRCRAGRVAEWRRRTKRRLVDEHGGECQLCGYKRFEGALQFHHLDPTQKRFGLAVRGLTRSIDELRAEASKCVLLCSNCHAEVEGGYASVSSDLPLTPPPGFEPGRLP